MLNKQLITPLLLLCVFLLANNPSLHSQILPPIPPPPCFYPDTDGDGYGDIDSQCIQLPIPTPGYVSNNSDCDDSDPSINIGLLRYYYDNDGDGLGNPDNFTCLAAPDPNSTLVTNNLDCNDTNPNITNETWYLDADGDFYKARPILSSGDLGTPPPSPSTIVTTCDSNPPGPDYINANDPRLKADFDCDDNDANVNLPTVWYADSDGDGLGDPNTSRSSCFQPNGYVSNNQDSCPNFASPENNCPYTPVQLSNENYIYTKVYLKELENDSLVSDDKDVVEQVTYYDGLGRPIQEIAIKDSPSKNDLVKHYEYDQFGRTEKTYLPLPTNQNTGSLVTNPVSQINTYYQTKYGDTNPFAQQRFNNSPMSRVLESAAPGNDWQLNAISDTDHTMKYEYKTNSSIDVQKYNINEDGSFIKSYYGSNELTKEIVKNENWNPTTDGGLNTTQVFIDKNGRKVSEITFNNSGSTGFEKLTTNYVYDNFGRLAYIITPKASGIDPVPFSYTEFDQYIPNSNFWTVKGATGPNNRGGAQFSLVGNKVNSCY